MTAKPAVVVKLGGELLRDRAAMDARALGLVRTVDACRLVIVHGGGNQISAALKQAGIEPKKVDGVRITDGPTLDIVVSVLSGMVNTQLVAALVAAGAPAVGLNGADAACVPVSAAEPATSVSGSRVDLGFVGTPDGHGAPALLGDLLDRGYLPVLASIGLGEGGALFNVNADAFAADVAARLGAARLVIAGATRGVYDGEGRTIPDLDPESAGELIASREASDGMVAKLRSGIDAVLAGVPEVFIADGTDDETMTMLIAGRAERRHDQFTRLTAGVAATRMSGSGVEAASSR